MTASYDAVVYDLDGTLVRLAVNWAATADRIAPILHDHGWEGEADDALDLLPVADQLRARAEVDPHLEHAEVAGARESARLSAMDELEGESRPVAICSLNCEAACREALSTHGVDREVAAIVGRDSVAERKPHPQPLLAAVERLGVAPERTLFVGDSDSDELTAQRAGTGFRRV
ncbi:HAD family hydrolase [Haloarchaeobius sp. TZWWS8]|uniref:HAD family hydrolase n=1 Tax=Haloarchaeobius sp. TZWWS8 TaxID=3446121 RepID=UPI003EBCFE85